MLILTMIGALPLLAFAPLRVYEPWTAADWIILLILVPVGILAAKAEKARVRKRRQRWLDEGVPEEEIPLREYQRDTRLRLRAFALIALVTVPVVWLVLA